MALGQPENELTVVVRYPNGKMWIHVHEVLARVDKKIRVDCPLDHDPYKGGVKPKYVTDYTIKNCRKLFKLMIQWLERDDLDRVDRFIKQNNEGLYKEWAAQRMSMRR